MDECNGKSEIAPQPVSRRARVAEAVARCAESKTYGDSITKRELMEWFALAYPRGATPDDVHAVDVRFAGMKIDFDSALLTRHKMAVESKGGGVWRIVLPAEQAALAAKVVRDGVMGALDKGGGIASNVDAARLNDAQRARNDFETSRIAGLRRLAEKALRSRAPRGLSSGSEKPSTEGEKPSTEGEKPSTEGEKPSTEGDK